MGECRLLCQKGSGKERKPRQMEHLISKMATLAVCLQKANGDPHLLQTESSPENQSAVSANHRSNVRITVSRNCATAPE
jgi:hypothetical protein